jgi:hypothetical protein
MKFKAPGENKLRKQDGASLSLPQRLKWKEDTVFKSIRSDSSWLVS